MNPDFKRATVLLWLAGSTAVVLAQSTSSTSTTSTTTAPGISMAGSGPAGAAVRTGTAASSTARPSNGGKARHVKPVSKPASDPS